MYPQKYFFKLKTEKVEFQSRLEQQLVFKASNKFMTHFSGQMYLESGFLAGEADENQFVVWQGNQFWSGLFYPIAKGQYLEIQGLDLIEIRIQFNPAAQIIGMCSSIASFFAITFGIVIQQNNELVFVILSGIVGIFLFIILQSTLLIGFIQGRNRLLKEIEERFELSRVEIRKRVKQKKQ